MIDLLATIGLAGIGLYIVGLGLFVVGWFALALIEGFGDFFVEAVYGKDAQSKRARARYPQHDDGWSD